MPTKRLYWDDPLLAAFTARVVAHGAWRGRPSAILDRTAFYPESGGQAADRGTLGDAAIADVQQDDDGVVHHVLDGALPPVGADVEGRIDRARRRLHMALHTGQHILSRALLDVARADTVSSRLGETACTIDVGVERVGDAELARAEELANAIVEDDVPIRAWFPDPAELGALPLRRDPKVRDAVRVVRIGEFDVSPCGGTHCVSSAQVGPIKVAGDERYKGGVRVTFAAGRRARVETGAHSDALRALGRTLSCPPDDVAGAVERLREEVARARQAAGDTRGRLADALAGGLRAGARADATGARVVARLDGADAELARAVARRLAATPGALAVIAAPSGDALHVVAARGEGGPDCRALVQSLCAAHGGRGGGRPEMAEGRLPAGVEWSAVEAAARAAR